MEEKRLRDESDDKDLRGPLLTTEEGGTRAGGREGPRYFYERRRFSSHWLFRRI